VILVVFYRLSDEDWEYFTEKGFIAIQVWGGFVFTHPDYKNILVDHESPELRIIEDKEFYMLAEKLHNYF
jgi:hypothetical protein